MNYSEVLETVNKASLFDLYRLKSAMHIMLKDPLRNEMIKIRLREGQDIEYFDSEKNRLVRARVLKLNRTRLLVENLEEGTRWDILYYMVNMEGADCQLTLNKNTIGLDKNEIAIGDLVGFKTRDGREIYGRIHRMNPKTVGIQTEHGRWRVAYAFLFKVLDAEKETQNQLTLFEG